jgi:hypothetical protein
MKKMVQVILAAAAIAALATPALAADKLVVKNSGGTSDVFKVTDAGVVNVGGGTPSTASKFDVFETVTVSGATQTTPISAVYNSGVMRTKLRVDGVQQWFLNSGSAEVGQIAYSTPGGGAGFGIWTGATYDQNKFTMVNYPDGGAGAPVWAMNYASYSTGSFALTPTGAAFGYSWIPRAEVEVTGTLMINDTPADGAGYKATRPTCSATKDGGLFYTVGGAGVASKLELCQKAAGGTYSWVLVK